jgi:hypothetical protein
MKQGPRLQIGHRAIFRGIGDLQDIIATIRRRQSKILVTLAIEPMGGDFEALVFGGEPLRAHFRNGGCGAQPLNRMRSVDVGRGVWHRTILQRRDA